MDRRPHCALFARYAPFFLSLSLSLFAHLSGSGDVVTDDNKSIFSELTSHGDLYTGDVRYHQPFDDVDDLRVLDESTQTLPCFFHGTGAGIGQVDQIGNYIPNSWSDSKGCQACAEWMVEDQAVLVRPLSCSCLIGMLTHVAASH